MGKASFTWTGRRDSSAPERIHQRIVPFPASSSASIAQPSITLIGFACDAGIIRNSGRPGASEGPRAARTHLANLCLPEQFAANLYDAGDISCSDDQLEAAQGELARHIAQIRSCGSIPLVLGGGHETAWGTYQGLARQLAAQRLGIINFDAHFDLRPLPADQRGSSGTPFTQIAAHCQQQGREFDYSCLGIQAISNTTSLWQRAHTLNVGIITADEMHLHGLTTAKTQLANVLDRCDGIYLSICLDVFSAAVAPGVSAPAALGLDPWQVIPLLRTLAASGKLVAVEIVELSPPHDQGERTAKLAAALAMEVLSALRF